MPIRLFLAEQDSNTALCNTEIIIHSNFILIKLKTEQDGVF
jgi:hypothetical protein